MATIAYRILKFELMIKKLIVAYHIHHLLSLVLVGSISSLISILS